MTMNTRRTSVVFFSLFVLAAGGAANMSAEEDRARWAAPPLDNAISIRDGRADERLSLGELVGYLAEADAVFLGESHADETTHRVELAVYEGLLARRDGNVTLAMEMFERDVQVTLDAYLAGKISEKRFLKQARPWNNYRAAYRPLIETAKSRGKPVIASNFPRPLRRRVSREGPEVLQSLKGDQRRQAPAELFPNTEAYWRRVDNAVRSHSPMMQGGERLSSTQSLWDNTMGESVARALDQYPGHAVLHINGRFHSAYWDGVVHQLRHRKPQANIRTVSIVPAPAPSVARLEGKPVADYVVFAEARATDVSNGSRSVYTSTEIDYEFHRPENSSSDEPVPLLIWLVPDGLRASDGVELWRERLGDTAAIAALNPPYRELQPDLSVGGRWFWPDSFASDVGAMVESVERVWGYLSRHYPIMPGRVCLAGEGSGATVVSAVTLLTTRMDVRGIALEPSKYAKLKSFSLPLPELQGDDALPWRSLAVFGKKEDRPWWDTELSAYADIGLETAWRSVTSDVWQEESQREQAVRDGLGLPHASRPPPSSKRYILINEDSPRARHWARLHAIRMAHADRSAVAVVEDEPEDSDAERISLEIRPATFTAKEALPRCPGPFGGTTVVVLPPDAGEVEVRDWTALEENDPIAETSRFHRLRVATGQGKRTLPAVLEKLQSENRHNVLIVPAVFHAGPAWMRSMRRKVEPFKDQMTLHWLPGLGGSEAVVVEQAETAAATKSPLR